MFRFPKKFSLTYVLIALNIAVYVFTSIVGGNFIVTGMEPIGIYGQVNDLVIYRGYYWQLFTSMFVHANIVHLLGNMLFLLIFGLRAEELFSAKGYLTTYFLSGLAGNLLTLLLTPLFRVDFISVGASGAIFGVFGAATLYIRRTTGQSMIGALMYAFFLLMISIGPNVNIAAHLGGLAVGLAIGYLLASRRKPRPRYQYVFKYSA